MAITWTTPRRLTALVVVATLLTGVALSAMPAPLAHAATPNFNPEIIDPSEGQDPDAAAAEAGRVEQLLASVPASRREEFEALMAELDGLDRQTEIAAEEYNAVHDRLRSLTQDIAQAQTDYAAITKAYNEQAEKVSQRVVALYRQGVPLEVALLLSADNLVDLLNVAEYLFDADGSETTLLARLQQEKVSLEETIASLSRDRAEAESLEFDVKARQIEVGYRVAEREAALERQSPSLVALVRAAQRAADQDEAELYYQITRGGIDNVKVEPGSPVETALAYRGVPYVWGGASGAGVDCSGFVVLVFAQHGVTLPHHSASQSMYGTPVTGELEPGDVVFFGSPIHHVGIYVGGGYYIHAPHTGDVVRIAKLASRSDLVGARRYDWQVRTAPIR